jgi:hypothetical protein
MDEPAVDGAIEAPSPNETDVSFHPLAFHYLEDDDDDDDDDDVDVDDDDDEEDDDDIAENLTKLRLIAPVYCAAKKVILSSSLKAHIEGSTELRRTLERRVLNIPALNKQCESDQAFAISVLDDVGSLRSVVMRLKEHDATGLFPDATLVVRAYRPLDIANVDLVRTWTSYFETGLLHAVSFAFKNRVDLIGSKSLFLHYLLEDLKKDEKLLRRHVVEYILLYDALVADAREFKAQLPWFPPRVGDFQALRESIDSNIGMLEYVAEVELSGSLFEAARSYIESSSKAAALPSAGQGELEDTTLATGGEGDEGEQDHETIATPASPSVAGAPTRITTSPSTAVRALLRARSGPAGGSSSAIAQTAEGDESRGDEGQQGAGQD